jgi:hypothetical protein
MSNDGEDLLSDIVQQMSAVKRKSLLPWWIKIFMWIFLIFGAFAPIGFVFGMLGYNFKLSLYGGLETSDPISITGICIILLFLLKGVTSYGLLRETDWAVKLGIIDAITGFAICVFVMFYPLFYSFMNSGFTFRVEILLLIPYLNKLLKIKTAWENAVSL